MTQTDFTDNDFELINDPFFTYEKKLLNENQILENGLTSDEVPSILFGHTGIGSGFCIYTGEHFIWIKATTIREALDFAESIVSFEPI